MSAPSIKGTAVSETPSFFAQIKWALIWFVAAMAVRIATIPLGKMFDESIQYILLWPISFASTVAIFGAALVVFMKFLFPNTLFKDSGTRFNEAFADIEDPFQFIMCYAALLAPVIIALAVIALVTP